MRHIPNKDRFIQTWHEHDSIKVIAERLSYSEHTVRQYAVWLRQQGHDLPHKKRGRKPKGS